MLLRRLSSSAPGINLRNYRCTGDSNQQYVAYVPDSGMSSNPLPVIYAFDPHADGALAASRIAPAASKLGYLVIGSGNFRNGSPDLDYIFTSLLNDTKQRFSIDPTRIYLAGFSGGARAAASIALNRTDIQGLVIAGAGLPGVESMKLTHWPVIYCMAGRSDFNMNEIVSTGNSLFSTTAIHTTRIFNGKHEWPPAEELEDALLWLELNAMKQKLISRDAGFIQWFYNRADSTANVQLSTDQPLAAMATYQGTIAALQGILSVKTMRKKADKLRETDKWKQAAQQQEKLNQMESNLQREYAIAFNNQPIAWWNKEMDVLNAKCAAEKDPDKLGMYNRLKGFLGVAAFSFTGQAIKAGDLKHGEALLAIYRLIEPDNPDCIYFEALLYDKAGKVALAAGTLQKAIAKGLSDKGKIYVDFSKSVIDLLAL